MVQPKYSPEEALERVKLMMKYNLSKTLTENKTLVLEQTTDLTIDDIKNGKSVVKSGMKGPIVGKIQELLISAGYNNISKSGDIDNDFGSLTKGQVEDFQSENTNDKGEPLQKDGKVGTETIKALLKKSDEKMRAAANPVRSDSQLRLAPKEFGQIPKGTQSVTQQTQTSSSDPLSCVKNYFQTKTLFYYKNAKYTQASVYGTGELEVTLNSNLTWKFLTWKDGKKTWKQYTDGDLSNNGVWSCDGDSNFTMRSTLGNFNFDSKNAEEFFKQIQSNTQSTQNQPVDQPTQTQPATQPTQTGPAAGYTDANQQSTLRRRDSILSDILDNQSVNKSVCRKNIRDFYTSFQQKNSIVVDPTTIAQARRIVQACKDQHYGKFGVLGRGGQNIDNMLDVLSGRVAGGPLTQGSDSMWRIK
jgi:hypothetical protein